jgi:SAM-dependent methyltransferase
MGVARWEARLYPELEHRDPVARFLRLLYAHIGPSCDVLDLGAGAGLNRYDLRGKVRQIVGVDLDPRVSSNPLLDRGIVVQPGPLPFEDNSFDVVFSIYVLEHVENPREMVAEIRRILRPNGVFLALTPNKNHYVPIIARLTPTSFHQRVNEGRGRAIEDTFPTVYRMNTRRDLLRQFAPGFECVTFEMLEVEPHYLKFWTPAFLAGAMYERLVNAFDWLAPFRVNIICAFRKTDPTR